MTTGKKKKYARRVFKSVSLGRALERFRKHYQSEDKPALLVVPYVLTCAAYLESKLNDSLSDFGAKEYGDDVAAALTSLSLRHKLNVLVPVLTQGKYRINKDHFVYQRLVSLIRVRNSIAHAKSELEEVVAGPDDLMETPVIPFGMAQIPRQFMNDPDSTLGASERFTPLEYHEALDKLEKWFFHRFPDKLSKVAMVIARSKEKHWKPLRNTYVKYFDD